MTRMAAPAAAIAMLCVLATTIIDVVGAHTMGCSMFDSTAGGTPYVEHDMPPQKLTDAQALKQLQSTCPELYHEFGGKDGEYCCASSQVNLLSTKLGLLHEIVVGCPACDHNFHHLWCYMTCAPYQTEFLNVTKTSKSVDGKDLVDTVDFYVAPTFGAALFDSCKEVKVSSMNTKAISTLCKSDDCTGWHMLLSKQGEKFPLLNPINIEFPLNSSSSVVPAGVETMNDTLPTCYDAVFGCSCGDCPQGPTCVKPQPPPPPKPPGCTALGFPPHSLSCVDVTLVLTFFVVAVTTVLWVGLKKVPEETYHSIAEPLIVEEGKPMEQSMDERGSSVEDGSEGGVRARAYVYDTVKSVMFDERRPLVLPRVERFLREWFLKQGSFIVQYPGFTLMWTLVFVGVCLLGLTKFKVETDPEKLWVPRESASRHEKQKFDDAFGKFYRIEQLILSQKDATNKSSIVSQETLELMFDMQDHVNNISMPVASSGAGHSGSNAPAHAQAQANTNATLEGICFKPFGPDGACATQSVLQYWQMDRATFEDAAKESGGDPHWMEFCFSHWITEESCFSAFKAPMDPKLVFGGFPKDEGNINYSNQSESLIVVYLVDNSEANLQAALAFETEFIRIAEQVLAPMADAHNLRLSYSSESSVQKELERESNADAVTVFMSFIAMFAYMTVVLGGARSFHPSQICLRTRILLGLGGVVLVMLSVLCAVGILSAFGVEATLLIMEVIPFLALAVGVDNMCILAHAMQDQDYSLQPSARVVYALSTTGPSITLAACTEFLAFLAGVLTGMPACKTFALFAAVTILIDYVFQVTAFVALLLLDELRIHHAKMDCVPCIRDARSDVADGYARHSFLNSVMRSLGSLLQVRIVQGTVLVVFFGIFLGALGTMPHLELGLEQTIALPKDSYLQDYFNDLASQLRVGPPVYFVVENMDLHPTSKDVNKTCATAGCDPNSMLNQIQRAAQIPGATYIATAAASWIDDYLAWIDPSLNRCCRMYSNETFCPVASTDPACETCFDGNSKDPLFHLHGNRPTIPQIEKTLPWFMEAVPSRECAKAGAGAYNTELEASKTDPTGYKGVKDGVVATSRFRGYHTPLATQKDFIEALRSAKDLSKQVRAELGLEVFPYSVFYVFFEQYLYMQYYALITFVFGAIGILFVCYAFLGTMWAAVLTMLVVMLTVFDIMGYMYFFGIQMNAVSLTNLAMSIGIALEFCIHIVRAFVVCDGPRQQRAATALRQMGKPVFEGIAVTKFIGVLVLSLSTTAIFQIFYFRMYLMLVVAATLHAFLLLPVLLMLAGPPPLPYATPLTDELHAVLQ